MIENNVSKMQKVLIVCAHLSFFLGGLGFIFVPLAIMLVCRNDGFVRFHAKQALVCHLVILVLALAILAAMVIAQVSGVDAIAYLSYLFMAAVIAAEAFYLFVTIIAAVQGCKGVYYKYPLIHKLA